LALAQEQMQIIELERRLVQAEAERGTSSQIRDLVGTDISDARSSYRLVQSSRGRCAGRDGRERRQTSAGHQRASDSKSRVALEAKVEKLEAKIQTMSSSEKELRQELDALLRSEKTNENSVSLNTTKM
jgi:hypothetical protein